MRNASRRELFKLAAACAVAATGVTAVSSSAGAVPLPKGIEAEAREESLVEQARWRWPWSRRRRRRRYYRRRRYWW